MTIALYQKVSRLWPQEIKPSDDDPLASSLDRILLRSELIMLVAPLVTVEVARHAVIVRLDSHEFQPY